MIEREEVIDYFKEYEKLKVEAIPRELRVPLTSKFIISIIGPRRSGKTYYLLMLKEKLKNVLYLNFEDSRLYEANYKDLREIIMVMNGLGKLKSVVCQILRIHRRHLKLWF